MRRPIALLGFAALALVAIASRVFSGDAPEAEDLTVPGPEHGILKSLEREWQMSGTVFGPTGKLPMQGRQTAKVIFGGRFAQIETEVSVGDQKLAMLEYLGYDRSQKKYVRVIMGDHDTTVSVDEGQHDASKKQLVLTGTQTLPDGKTVKSRQVIHDVEGSSYRYEAYTDDGGGEHMDIESTFTRKK